MSAFQQGSDAIIQAFGQESGAAAAALVFKKVAALAEIGINLQRTLALNQVAAATLAASVPILGPALGAAYLVTHNALAIAQAAVGAATVLAFEQGGIAQGPSHREGGIPLFYRGRPAGIEIEGGEPVLTKRVSENPLLLSLASAVNQLAGGRALAPNLPTPHLAVGGIAQPLILDQLRGTVSPGIDYDRLANALRKVPLSVSVRDTKAANARDNYTEQQANI